jgi:hypothetical protein
VVVAQDSNEFQGVAQIPASEEQQLLVKSEIHATIAESHSTHTGNWPDITTRQEAA